ncbi:MAG: hypothetical protein JHC61_14340, partial [Burkholderiaceae bacterium]|nr:hypothetical protein [Burkholderiaceae bacterium]
MPIASFTIEGKPKRNMLTPASTTDFILKKDWNLSTADFADLVGFQPYCLDLQTGHIWLVDSVVDAHADSSPFLYESQYLNARRVVSVDIAIFADVAMEFPLPDSLTFVHSTGRCGSTLFAQLLLKVRGIPVLSEPDVFTNLAAVGRMTDGEQARAFGNFYQALIRYFSQCSPHLVIKFRSMAIQHAELLAQAVPWANNIFLYRDATEVMRSYARIHNKVLGSWKLDELDRRRWRVFAPGIELLHGPVDGYDLMAAFWAAPVLKYLDSRDSGLWTAAIDYAALARNPEATLRGIFPDEAIDAAAVRCVMSAHSQNGSHLSGVKTHLHPAL